MSTLNSPTSKWIWFAVVLMLYVIANFENISFSAILKEMGKSLCADNNCTDFQKGFVKTPYYIMKIVSSPVSGYLGDRVSRKYLLIGALCLWSGFGFLMTFMEDYWSFVWIKAATAVGMVVANNLGPTILADLFSENMLTRIYGIYYLSIPFGLGLGLVVPNALLDATGNWQDALRLTPGLLLAFAIIIFFLTDPPRAETESNEEEKGPLLSPAAFWSDLKYVMSKTPFVLQMVAVTCTTFCGQTLNHWLASVLREAIVEYNNVYGDGEAPIRERDVSYYMGVTMIVAGTLGIITGSTLSSFFRRKWQDDRTDLLLIGASTLLSVPFICISASIAQENVISSYVLLAIYLFFGHIFLPIGMAFTMTVIEPSKRSFALSVQRMCLNGFGKVAGQNVFGLITEAINPSEAQDKKLAAYQLAFIPSYVALFIAGVFYIAIVCIIPKDKETLEKESISMGQAEEGKITIKTNSPNEEAEGSSEL